MAVEVAGLLTWNQGSPSIANPPARPLCERLTNERTNDDDDDERIPR